MGEVYRAYDEALQRPVAIKLIATAQQGRAQARARFWREARALAALNHPSVVRVHRIDEEDGQLYMAMELVDGWPLSDRLDVPWAAPLAIEVVRQAALGVGAAHQAGLIHRDLKPANLLIDQSGAIRVVDFGLARTADGVEDLVTGDGARIGTLTYMAPEQLDGAELSPASDVFALGTVLYRLLAGTHPFARETPTATALAIACARYPELPETIDGSLRAVVDRCLTVDPAARFEDGDALAAALLPLPRGRPAAIRAFIDGHEGVVGPPESSLAAGALPTIESSEPNRWLLLGVSAAILGVAVFFMWDRTPTAEPVRAVSPPMMAEIELPTRPVVGILGFSDPETDQDDPRAAILSDVARVVLARADPQAVQVVPLSTLEALFIGQRAIDDRLPVEAFSRRHRGLGNVDMVVRGHIKPDAELLQIEIEAVRPSDSAVINQWVITTSDDVVGAGVIVAQTLADVLDVTIPSVQPPTRSADAYGAYLQARTALRIGQFGPFENSLDWALHLDPDLIPARLIDLERLRGMRRYEDLSKAAQGLLKRADLTPSDRGIVTALQAISEDRGEDAIRTLHTQIETWPNAIDAYDLLVSIRFNNLRYRDLQEAERIGKDALKIAPKSAVIISRLLRAMAWRGRVDEARSLLVRLKIPTDEPGYMDLWGELYLYAQEYDAAIAQFQAALAEDPNNLYAEHMGLAAQILVGRCQAAAASALDRINRIEALGKDKNLDWTYSLAIQALICREQWPSAEVTMDRWAKRSDLGKAEVIALRPRVAQAAGLSAAEVTKATRNALKVVQDNARPELLRLLARVAEDPAALDREATKAEAQALDPFIPPGRRSVWLFTQQALSLRARLLRSTAETVDRVLADYDALFRPWSEVHAEGDLRPRVEALTLYAEALEWAGREDAAQMIWTRIINLGYPRLWSTDLWVTARQRLKGE